MLKLIHACTYCKGHYEVGFDHLYQCPVLHERILDIHPKKGTRKSQPLDALTHATLVPGCNCKHCIERLAWEQLKVQIINGIS